ncbi:hypothetical protein TsFJ059_008566 [Trichoderma semiorbis]|uniref:Uncharacterized protein n=1 Tax=Trichoderma semiorbis TaxID=1491008 RepID=A0A9P8KP80_9HYPO|nr:hypothetical protein TsFJ059_008566 [Trichoderma semiorbis]
MDSFPSKEKQLLMDPVEFWSSQKAPKRPSSSASQRPPVRSASKDRDDPLLTAPPARVRAPERTESRQSRIAVVLKSPAHLNRSSWSHIEGENGGDSRAAAVSASSRQGTPSFASRAKKETPVPLPKTLNINTGSRTRSCARGCINGSTSGSTYTNTPPQTVDENTSTSNFNSKCSNTNSNFITGSRLVTSTSAGFPTKRRPGAAQRLEARHVLCFTTRPCFSEAGQRENRKTRSAI